MSAPIKVGNEAGFTESSVKFQYKDIHLDGLFPRRGPQSGGTKVLQRKSYDDFNDLKIKCVAFNFLDINYGQMAEYWIQYHSIFG